MNIRGEFQTWSEGWEFGVWVLFLLEDFWLRPTLVTGFSIAVLFCPREGEVGVRRDRESHVVPLKARPDTWSSKVISLLGNLASLCVMLLKMIIFRKHEYFGTSSHTSLVHSVYS